MKKSFITILFLATITLTVSSQDNRTTETRVADLLARMPAYNQSAIERQMREMGSLPVDGWDMIFNQLREPGEGDDTAIRFAIESYSRYVTKFGMDDQRHNWEIYIIERAKQEPDDDLLRFMVGQLMLSGDQPSGAWALSLFSEKRLVKEALSLLELTGYRRAETRLLADLESGNCTEPAALLNLLAKWQVVAAPGVYEKYAGYSSVDTRAAALRALAAAGQPSALRLLAASAGDSNYMWDPTGATSSYLSYADRIAELGDLRGMERICREVLKNSTSRESVQYRCDAMSLLAKHRGHEIIPDLVAGFSDPDFTYRNHLLNLAADIPGEVATRKFFDSLKDVNPLFVQDVIRMISRRGDLTALPRLTSMMFSADKATRMVAAEGAVRLGGTRVAGDLITYLLSYPELDEQERGFSLFSQIADERRTMMLADRYESAPEITKAFILMIVAEGGDNSYFDMIFNEVNSPSDLVRNAAIVSLKNVAAPGNIESLLELLNETNLKPELEQVQYALAVAVAADKAGGQSAGRLLSAITPANAAKIIPVLPSAGTEASLDTLLGYFNRGGELRIAAFDALTAWPDYRAAYRLFDICRTGEEIYRKAAFEAYVRQVTSVAVPAEQKLLLLRKIAPFATSPEHKILILEGASGVHTIPSLQFVATYLDSEESTVSLAAARSAITIIRPQPGSPDALYGTIVRDMLTRVIDKLTGPESEYAIESIRAYLDEMPPGEGFVAIFNGRDLEGWQGLVENPIARAKMSRSELAKRQAEANREMMANWSVRDNAIWFTGHGANLCTVKSYADFEMLVDWKITKDGDSGIYLRGTPQVQIWDTSRTDVGAQVGSGGLYNNSRNRSTPLTVADNPVGDWNSFRILMTGERVSVWLNGILVVDDTPLENYWDRSIPIFPAGPIELQAHGNELAFRDIYVREIRSEEYGLTPAEIKEGFVSLFNGKDLEGWTGNKVAYVVEDGNIVVKPGEGSGGNLYTSKEYSNFNFRFEFQLTPGANNGLGIRAPLEGDAAYLGMELQILDNTASIYANLQPYQYHGSVYGVIPAKRGFLKPVGEWNQEEVIVDGTRVTVVLNGEVIVDGDIADARDNGTMDHQDHPGLKRTSGHIGFLGHGSEVKFRKIRIKELEK